jgi:non-heme chloroperoxidase
MNFIKTDTGINLFYTDLNPGNAVATVVLIHGWPLHHAMWDYQLAELPLHGIRVIAYDRRGFGLSDKPVTGYDYDTLTNDLKAILDGLDLQDVTLAGFSMGGGEVARYFGNYGGARVSKAVLISAVTPFLLKTDDNPTGVDQSVFDDMAQQIKKDRADFLQNFAKSFYSLNLLNHTVSEAQLQGDFSRAYMASHRATIDCANSFATTDFRRDLMAIHVPTLIIHGDDDKTVPIEASGEQTAQLMPNAQYVVYGGAPHGLFVTEKDRLNQDLANFILARNTSHS